MKRHLIAIAALVPAMVSAAPFLYADPYPPSATQPDAARFTVNGAAPIQCVLEAVTGGVRPKCDLASITAPGTYTLVMTVSRAAGIVNTTGGATNDPGGSAPSDPFTYVLRAGSVAKPVLSVAP